MCPCRTWLGVDEDGRHHLVIDPAPLATRPVYDREAANQRKIGAVQQLAPLADALDHIDARIDELVARTRELERGRAIKDQLCPGQLGQVDWMALGQSVVGSSYCGRHYWGCRAGIERSHA